MNKDEDRVRLFCVIAAGSCLFAFLAWQVQSAGALFALDQSISGWLQAHRTPWFTQPLLVVTHWHSTPGILAMTLLIAAIAGYCKRWRDAAFAVTTIGGGMLLNLLLKQVFARSRPVFDAPLITPDGFSFPSGHAAGSMLLYGTLMLLLAGSRWRNLAVWLGTALVLVVASSRVYLGVHYLSDVVAGIAGALVWISVCWLTMGGPLKRVA